MINQDELQERFKMVYDAPRSRRNIADKEIIVHCHLYNARLQNTIEETKQIDGKKIIVTAAEAVFSEQINNASQPEDSVEDKWQVAGALYSHLGYGKLDFSKINEGVITASSSHYVEGWNSGFKERKEPVCTFTQGFLQGAIHAITGESVYVKEEKCMISGDSQCHFVVDKNRSEPFTRYPKSDLDFSPNKEKKSAVTSNIDEKTIIDALVGMPIYGNDDGVIPAFSVYLSNTPADYYNLVTINFVEEMKKKNMLSTAKKLLVYSGEVCGMSTFRGIMNSPEWEGLIAPMVKDKPDELHGLVAVSNALGWGNWYVKEHVPSESLGMVSLNGYEAVGYLEYKGKATSPQCFMLSGVVTSFMQLVYSEGSLDDRFGTFFAEENDCICTENDSCNFHVEQV